MNKFVSLIKQNLVVFVVILVAAIGVVTVTTVVVVNNISSDKGSNLVQNLDETGWIYVDGGDGTLTGFDGYGYTYIGESARGTEAYLAEKDATANYEFDAPATGTYKLQVSLSDDAVHDNGARSASVAVNGVMVLHYDHISENTNGWKWYTLGNVSLKKGTNKVAFTKDESTSAAYVMDQFRLIPQPNL